MASSSEPGPADTSQPENDQAKSPSVECSPKKGLTTLSTSTSSYEPLETHDPTLNRLAVTMFQKVHEYLQAELTSSESEYQLLEQMNKVTAAKYKDLTQVAGNVGKGIIELNAKFKSLEVYLEQIDQIEDNISKLEHAAYKLDAYTVRLENKFKALTAEKR
uniref:EOG090X0J9J n=1 Tax=Daphnia pulicaria TaxID=35523 RepID=A0A4Y7MYW5_9CRUS|nr:EOG090X0J9J [Daphnia pulicaria]